MVKIRIKPAARLEGGYLIAEGHAGCGPRGADPVCAAITALIEGLAANLKETWDVHVSREAKDGDLVLRWNKSDKEGRGLRRANDAAGFTYISLRALEMAWPKALHVEKIRPRIERRA